MLKTDIVTQDGQQYLEVKKDKHRFLLEMDVLSDLDTFLRQSEESTLSYDGTIFKLDKGNLVMESGNIKIAFSATETFRLADAIAVVLHPIPEEPKIVVSKGLESAEPSISPAKLAVIEIAVVPIEWQAWVICPKCKGRFLLDTRPSPSSTSQIATQCNCGQIMFLQK